MTNEKHVSILEQGVEKWNLWRDENPGVKVDLRDADLQDMNLQHINLSGVDLRRVNLCNANLADANLRHANLTGTVSIDKRPNTRLTFDPGYVPSDGDGREDYGDQPGPDSMGGEEGRWSGPTRPPTRDEPPPSGDTTGEVYITRANLRGANMSGADLSKSDLKYADMQGVEFIDSILYGATLYGVNLSGAQLLRVNMRYARLLGTNLEGARIENCSIYGISTWGLNLVNTIQSDLIITPRGEPSLTVDDLETAQFIYTLLTNEKLRKTIDTITSKVVLILGRFTPEQKATLDGIREALRKRNYIPVLFDFQKPVSRDITETVSTLAHMARFIIADITDARSIPQELQRIIPELPSVPVQPILLVSDVEYGMFEHFKRYPWVLKTHVYGSKEELVRNFDDRVINPLEGFLKGLSNL